MIAGNISVIANKIGNTATLAREGGFDDTVVNEIKSNGPNDQKFAQMIVADLNQATISPEIQGQAFAEALTQALNTQAGTEAPDIIIAAAIKANQTNSIMQGFAQVYTCGNYVIVLASTARIMWLAMQRIGCAICSASVHAQMHNDQSSHSMCPTCW